MDQIREKLARCFALTFPGLERSRIPEATSENIAGWDSVAHVTLLSLIGEEFGIDVDFEAFEGATSFEALAERLSTMSVS